MRVARRDGDRNGQRYTRARTVCEQRRGEQPEVLANAVRSGRARLADAARECDGIEAAQHGGVGADVLANTMRVDRDGTPAVLVAFRCAPLDGREVDGAA